MNLHRLFGLVSANQSPIKGSATSNRKDNWKLSRLTKVFGYAVATGVALFIGNSIRADEQGTRHVVIFSTSDYSNHKLPNLQGNVAEAEGFKQIMEKSPTKKIIHSISDGSASELYLNLEKINRSIAKSDELIVYVTGHGFENSNNPEPNVIVATKENKELWIDTSSLIKALGSGNLATSKKLLIVDTCRQLVNDDTMASASQTTFSGTIIKGNSLQANSHPALALANGKRSEKEEMDYQLAVIYSCQSGSESIIHQDRGIFANALRLAFVSTSDNKESISLNDVLEKTKNETIKNARILGQGQRPEIEIFTAKSANFELDWQIGYKDNQKALAEAKQLENVESNASKRTIADAGRSMQGSRAAVATSAATKAEKVGAGLQTAGTIASMAGAGRVGGYLGMAGTIVRGAGAIRRGR
jgi:hypothetical protein